MHPYPETAYLLCAFLPRMDVGHFGIHVVHPGRMHLRRQRRETEGNNVPVRLWGQVETACPSAFIAIGGLGR